MNVVIGIMIGALAVGLMWVIVYFNQEIHDLRAETRARESTYRPTTYASYSESMLRKERDDWRQKYEDLLEEVKKEEDVGE